MDKLKSRIDIVVEEIFERAAVELEILIRSLPNEKSTRIVSNSNSFNTYLEKRLRKLGCYGLKDNDKSLLSVL
jgi:hypothetical protein